MADVKIASLTASTTPTDTDIMIIEDNSDTKKITFANIKSVLKTYFDSLYGTIANLNLKAPLDNPTFTGTQTLPNIVTNGIKFPATQVPSADPNTLDDYEEGTWTPTTSTPNLSLSINETSYTKIGNMVFAKCYIVIENTSGSVIPAYQIGGLPFSSSGYGFTTSYFLGSQVNRYIETGTHVVNWIQDLAVGSNLRMYQFVYHTF